MTSQSPHPIPRSDFDGHQKLWRFGPKGRRMLGTYGLSFEQNAVNLVSDKVIDISGCDTDNLIHKLRNIEPEVRAAYQMERFDDKDFLMLARDCIFFVLVIFSILGVELGILHQHPIFGTGNVRKNLEKWIKSILFVGNQVPLVMVRELMESLDYLKILREKTRQMAPPVELLYRAFYELVTNKAQESRPINVLDCLRLNLLGQNLQQNHIWVMGNNDHSMPQLSASKLSEQGYEFRSLPMRSGSREIRCKYGRSQSQVVVFLPYLHVSCEMRLKLLMDSVDKFEEIHGMEPESRRYFNLLSVLIRKPEDVEVLLQHGVIGGVDLDCLPRLLQPFYGVPPDNASFRLRREIQMHTSPFRQFWKYRWHIICVIVVLVIITIILAFLENGHTIFDYYKYNHH